MDLNVWNRASEVPHHIHDAHRDSRRPIYHPLAPRGWSSDPCGPISYKGRYHLFYQHQHASCQWTWGLCWDHVVSDDLLHWRNLPPAVVATPGGLDADGCFSGTVEIDPELGVPVILYTGVYLKTNAEAVSAHGLPAPEHDPGTRFVEKQLAAVPADPDDPDLTWWVKLPSPVMALPPAGINISCWRDPFCLKRPAAAGGEGDEWVVLLASGIRGVGGAVLRFKSKHFTHGWQFDGVLASGDNTALGITGQDWECPILAELPCMSKDAITAAIAVSTAAIPAAIAAKLPEHLSLAAIKPPQATTVGPDSNHATHSNTSSSSGSSSKSEGISQAPPGTPTLRSARLAADSASMSSLSQFGGSSVNLAAAAATAAADADVAPRDSSSSLVLPESGSSAGWSTTANTTSTTASAALAAAVAIAAAGSATAAAAAVDRAAPGMPSAEAATAVQTSVLTLPLTEPALAAATSAAEAAPAAEGHALLKHPAVCVDTWVQHQTQQQVESATAGASILSAGLTPAGTLSSLSLSADDDLTVVIAAEDDSCDPKQQQLALAGSSGGKRWWFCISPDACNNPVTWWLGDYDGRRFDIAAADGPHRLELGTTLYAATLWQDPKGRQLLYGWIQEHRRVPTPPALCEQYSYAGCISTPRVLQLVDGQLWQTPLPEINALRTSVCWRAKDLLLCPGSQLIPLQVVSGTHLDINLTLLPPAGATAHPDCTEAEAEPARAGLVFKSWKADGKGAAVLSFDWCSGSLIFDFDEPFPDAYTPHPDDTPARRRVGGKLRHYTTGEPLSLRILLDGSAVEMFTSTGETLTTRLYRGHPPKCACAGCTTITCSSGHGRSSSPTASSATSPADAAAAATACSASAAGFAEDEAGIALFAAGAAVTVPELCVWEMGSCWVPPIPPPPQPPALLQQQQLAAIRMGATVSTVPALVAAGGRAVSLSSSSDAWSVAAPLDAKVSTAAAGASAAVHGAEQLQHQSAGQQAVVQEAFLEQLNIHAV